ncbi:MAG: thermonuclease family protein [Candidatus Methylomirabilota bacterium]
MVFLVFAVASLVPIVPAGADELARVKQVYDGDTALLEDGRRVRYLGINAPEFREPFYLKAKRFNESLVQGREVRLEFDVERADAHDRLLAYVYVTNQMVNAELVRQGLAHAFFVGPGRRHNALFLRLQNEARQRRLGIWSVRGRPKDLKITSVRLRNPADPDPHTPYVRIANLSNDAIRLAGHVLSNESGSRFVFPDVVVEPGYTVLVTSTSGPDGADNRGQLVVHWPGQVAVWDPSEDTAFLLDPAGTVVDTFPYKARRTTRSPRASRSQNSRGM